MTATSKKTTLGKNRDTPPPPITPTRYLRKIIRKTMGQRLAAAYYDKHRETLRGSSVIGCGRWLMHGAKSAKARILVEGPSARFDGHFVCGCNWTCEECATATVARNRSWLRAALIPALEARGKTASLMTLTLAHRYGDDWGSVVDGLGAAYTLFGRRVDKVLKRYGCVGKFKALEAPVGRNGIHPHFHILVTHDVGLTDEQFAKLEADLRAAWDKAVAEVGGRTNVHGFDFKPNCINDYVTKMETSHELAAQSTKQGREKGKTLSQLLDASWRGDATAAAEWTRAIKAIGSKNRFHAGSLPKNLGIPTPSEWDDEQPEEADENEADAPEPEVVCIEYDHNDHMMATHPALGRPGLAMILRAARRGGETKVLSMVAALCRDYRRKFKKQTQQVHDQVFLDLAEQVMAAAKVRPLRPDEVPVYLLAKSSGLVFSSGSRVGAEAAAEHRPSADSSHLVEHRTGEHRAKRTLDADENMDKLAVGLHGVSSHANLPSGERRF
jgi:hypothetical protein